MGFITVEFNLKVASLQTSRNSCVGELEIKLFHVGKVLSGRWPK
jgi:hypothetical protein